MIKIIKKISTKDSKNLLIYNLSKIEKVLNSKQVLLSNNKAP